MEYFAIIVAAGNSTRFGDGINKLLVDLPNGMKVIDSSIELFIKDVRCTEILVACNHNVNDYLSNKLSTFPKKVTLIAGGATRSASVWNCMKTHPTGRYVLIHDGARPFATQALLDRLLANLQRFEGVIPGLPACDSLKTITQFNTVNMTLERKKIVTVQTPQAFHYDKVFDAYQAYYNNIIKNQIIVYDDSQVLELYGHNCLIKVVAGDLTNQKITYRDDLVNKSSSILFKG